MHVALGEDMVHWYNMTYWTTKILDGVVPQLCVIDNHWILAIEGPGTNSESNFSGKTSHSQAELHP